MAHTLTYKIHEFETTYPWPNLTYLGRWSFQSRYMFSIAIFVPFKRLCVDCFHRPLSKCQAINLYLFFFFNNNEQLSIFVALL